MTFLIFAVVILLLLTVVVIAIVDENIEKARRSGFDAGHNFGYKIGYVNGRGKLAEVEANKEALDNAYIRGSGDFQAQLFAIMRDNPDEYHAFIDKYKRK
jgi:hypothetical protein